MDPISDLVIDEVPGDARVVLVLDDDSGELGASALALPGVAEVRGWCDLLTARRVMAPGVRPLERLDAEGLAEVDLVLMKLPKALAALDEYAELIALHAAPGVRIVAGGRDKHMTRGMNDTLGAHFAEVRASLGRQKCRVLHASGPRRVSPEGRSVSPEDRSASLSNRRQTWPKSQHHPDLGLTLVAHGAVFAGNRVDAGTRLLLQALVEGAARSDASRNQATVRAIDLGCGNGVIAAVLARSGHQVLGVDVSAAACESTRATAAANDLEIEVLQADGLSGLAPGSADLVVTNPPFHIGTAKDSTPTLRMFEEAAEVLVAGGEFWCVFNSHLPYLQALREHIGRTDIVTRDRNYTVTRSVRRGKMGG